MSGSEGYQVRIRVYRPVLIANSMGIGVANGPRWLALHSSPSLVHNDEMEMGGEPGECC